MSEMRKGRAPTSDDVAALAGVSRSAVSRTFTKGASVAPETRKKVMEAAAAIGYRVNFLARGLSQQRTNLVGLVVSDMDNSFRARLVDRLSRLLIELDYRPFMLPSSADENTDHLVDMMLHYNVAGAIVTSDTPPAEITERCAAHGVPLVLVNKQTMAKHVANVSLNSDQAGYLAARTLSETGCKRIAIASQRRMSHSIALRKKVFIQTCGELGIEIEGDYQGEAQNYWGGAEAGRAFLASAPKVDGCYCVNDYLALGFVDMLRRDGRYRIPDDVQIIACDDIDEASWFNYDLTTIRQDPSAIANATIDALLQRIEFPGSPSTHTIIDVQLVERSSTRPRKLT